MNKSKYYSNHNKGNIKIAVNKMEITRQTL